MWLIKCSTWDYETKPLQGLGPCQTQIFLPLISKYSEVRNYLKALLWFIQTPLNSSCNVAF